MSWRGCEIDLRHICHTKQVYYLDRPDALLCARISLIYFRPTLRLACATERARLSVDLGLAQAAAPAPPSSAPAPAKATAALCRRRSRRGARRHRSRPLLSLNGARSSPLLDRGDHVPHPCRGWRHGGLVGALWVGCRLLVTPDLLQCRGGPMTLLSQLRLWWQLRQRPPW